MCDCHNNWPITKCTFPHNTDWHHKIFDKTWNNQARLCSTTSGTDKLSRADQLIDAFSSAVSGVFIYLGSGFTVMTERRRPSNVNITFSKIMQTLCLRRNIRDFDYAKFRKRIDRERKLSAHICM